MSNPFHLQWLNSLAILKHGQIMKMIKITISKFWANRPGKNGSMWQNDATRWRNVGMEEAEMKM